MLNKYLQFYVDPKEPTLLNFGNTYTVARIFRVC